MVRLDRLVNVLGGYGTHLYSSPVARDIELRSVVLYDATDTRCQSTGRADQANGKPPHRTTAPAHPRRTPGLRL